MRLRSAFLLCCIVLAPAAAGPIEEQNKAIALGFFQVLDQGRLDRYADSHAADFVVHTGQGDLPISADMAAAAEERKAMPDMHFEVHRMVAESDMVVVHWTASGTNTGDGMGFHATGKKLSVPGMTIFRFKAGKISEEWSVFDMLLAYHQAGLMATK